MNIFIILVYGTIAGLTILLLSIVLSYLKNKATNIKSVRDQIQIDLASFNMSFISLTSTIILVRELVGPFQSVTVVDSIFMILQSLFDVMLTSIVSLQIYQILSIFHCPALNEWQEANQVYNSVSVGIGS